MKVQEIHLFENTAPSGPGGFVAVVTVRVTLADETYEDAIAKLSDALVGFALPSVSSRASSPEPEPEKATRRRRGNTQEAADPDPEPEPEKPARRRRRGAEAGDAPKGPSKEDVAKAASAMAEKCGTKIAAEVIAEFSPETGKIDDIPADKREAFIDEATFQMSDD